MFNSLINLEKFTGHVNCFILIKLEHYEFKISEDYIIIRTCFDFVELQQHQADEYLQGR